MSRSADGTGPGVGHGRDGRISAGFADGATGTAGAGDGSTSKDSSHNAFAGDFGAAASSTRGTAAGGGMSRST
ncbi:MAG: hypothetical protein KC417_15840, partial [Myxococcales bacterium]|nr:hypothetical protein [Myxococcales bacterium]